MWVFSPLYFQGLCVYSHALGYMGVFWAYFWRMIISYPLLIPLAYSCRFTWIFVLVEAILFFAFILSLVHLDKTLWLQGGGRFLPNCSFGPACLRAWTASVDACAALFWVLDISSSDYIMHCPLIVAPPSFGKPLCSNTRDSLFTQLLAFGFPNAWLG